VAKKIISLRVRLEAIAAGRPIERAPKHSIQPDIAKQGQPSFTAWSRFAASGTRGESLAAPADLLPPLP